MQHVCLRWILTRPLSLELVNDDDDGHDGHDDHDDEDDHDHDHDNYILIISAIPQQGQ